MNECVNANSNNISKQNNTGLLKQAFLPLRDPSLSRVVKSLRELPCESRILYSNNINTNFMFNKLRIFEQANLYEGYIINKYTYKVLEAYLTQDNDPKKTIENICDAVLMSDSDITLSDPVSKIAFYFIDKTIQGVEKDKALNNVAVTIASDVLHSTTKSIFKKIKSILNQNFALRDFYSKTEDPQPKIDIEEHIVDEAGRQLSKDKEHFDKIWHEIDSVLNNHSISFDDSIIKICEIVLNDEGPDFLGKIKLQAIYEIKKLLYKASKSVPNKTQNQKNAMTRCYKLLNKDLNKFSEDEIILKIYETFVSSQNRS